MSELIGIDECENLTVKQVQNLYGRYVSRSQVNLMTSFGFGRELVERAEGAWIWTRDGRRILDFTGGVGVLNHGHNHPAHPGGTTPFRRAAAHGGAQDILLALLAALSHNLATLLPGDLNISYFPNSGAEANEGAVKMAYKYHGGRRNTILRSDISFHGKTLGAGSLTGSSENAFRFPGLPGHRRPPVRRRRGRAGGGRRRAHPEGKCDVYALMVEPFSASSMRCWSETDLRELRRLCDERRHRPDLRRDLHGLG